MAGTKTAKYVFFRFLIFFVAVPFLIIAVLYESDVNGPIDLFHEGESLTPASETLRGKLPFRDIYLQHGWGANLLRSKFAFALFGVSAEANRRMSHGSVKGYLIPLAWISVYFLLYALFRKKILIVPTLAILGFADTLICDRHILVFLSMAFLVFGKKRYGLNFFLAGVLALIGFFYSLDTGVYAFAIGATFIAVCSIAGCKNPKGYANKAVISYLSGAAIGAFPFVCYLIWQGILDDFMMNCFFQLRYQAETWGIPLPSLASLLGPFENATTRNRTIYAIIKWYYPVLTYVLVCILLIPKLALRKLDESDLPLMLIVIAGIFFYRSAAGRADEGHLMYAIAPFWIMNFCFIERALLHVRERGAEPDIEEPPWSRKFHRICFNYFSICLVVVGLALYFWATCKNGGIVQRKTSLRSWKKETLPQYVALNVSRAGKIKLPPEQAEEIERTVAAIQAHSDWDQPIFDFSNQGAYYFLADRTSSIRFCQIAYATPPPLQERVVEELESSAPALVIIREGSAPEWAVPNQPLIENWIRENYPFKLELGPNAILLPEIPGENVREESVENL